MSLRAGRLVEVPETPRSMNSLTTIAPMDWAFFLLAARWAGIEKPSSRPPLVACSLVETRRYITARLGVRPSVKAAIGLVSMLFPFLLMFLVDIGLEQ